MRLLPLTILFVALGIPQISAAQESLLNIYCQDCRDLNEYPQDARNFAVNQLFGASSWLTADQADRFMITDPYGNTVTADINATIILQWTDFPSIRLPFQIPLIPLADKLIIQVRIISANGDILTYRFETTDLDPNGTLPVPAGQAEPDVPETEPVEPDPVAVPGDTPTYDSDLFGGYGYDSGIYYDAYNSGYGWSDGYVNWPSPVACVAVLPNGSAFVGVRCKRLPQ